MGCGACNQSTEVLPGHCLRPEDRCFLIFNDVDDPGQDGSNVYGCDRGCVNCDDQPGDWQRYGVSNLGNRFLRYYLPPSPESGPKQARDAHGNWHDLKSGEPWLVPKTTSFIRGTSYSNQGLECVNNACLGIPQPDTVSDPTGHCDDGAANFELVKGLFPDAFFYSGSALPGCNANNVWCRNIRDRTVPQIVTTADDLLHQTCFLRSGGRPIKDVDPTCTSNLLIGCVAKVVAGASFCIGAFDHELDVLEGRVENYNQDDGSRQGFNLLGITVDAKWRDDPDLPFVDKGRNLIKNAVMKQIRNDIFPGWSTSENGNPVNQGEIRFDQLDILPFRGIGFYSRSFNASVTDGRLRAPADILPTVKGINLKIRLAHSRCELKAELVIKSVTIDLSLVAHHQRWQASHSQNVQSKVFPYVSVRIGVSLGVRTGKAGSAIDRSPPLLQQPADPAPITQATERELVSRDDQISGTTVEPTPLVPVRAPPRRRVGDCVLEQPWLPEDHPERFLFLELVQNDFYANPFPTVVVNLEQSFPQIAQDPEREFPTVPSQPDRLQYVVTDDDGNEFVSEIDSEVQWWGCLNDFSRPRTANTGGMDLSTSLENACRGLASQLQDIEVPGWHIHTDTVPDDPSGIWGGALRFSFILPAELVEAPPAPIAPDLAGGLAPAPTTPPPEEEPPPPPPSGGGIGGGDEEIDGGGRRGDRRGGPPTG